MSVESLNATVRKLAAATEALGVIGAELRLRQGQARPDPQVSDAMQQVIQSIDPGLMRDIPVDQAAVVLSAIQSVFRHAADLLEHPARSPGWSFADAGMIQSQGRQSRRAVAAIEDFAAKKPDLRRALREPGAFLDVGCGAGWLSIEAAQCWPALRTVGIDPWAVALDVARANIVAAGMEGRIELREQGIEHIQDRNEFSLVWLPGPFIPRAIVPKALTRAHDALRPGGWMVFSLFGATQDALNSALAELRAIRYGGHPWKSAEIEEQLRNIGFSDIETAPSGHPVAIVVGRKSLS